MKLVQDWSVEPAVLTLVTWNCCAGFAKKQAHLDELRWDVAVVPECSERDASAYADAAGLSLVWDGDARKGLAVFAREAVLELDERYEPEFQFVLPVRVAGRQTFHLLAVWTKLIKWQGRDLRYVRLLHPALDHYEAFVREQPTVLMGDLNSSANFDSEHPGQNHTLLVERLERLGLESAYHYYSGESQGEETTATHYFWRRRERPFHIDYCFVPREWLPRAEVTVGGYDDWIAHSDHAPLGVEMRFR